MSKPNIIPSIFTAVDAISATTKKIGLNIGKLGLISTVTSARMERSFNRVSTAAMQIGHSGTAIGLGLLIPLGLATKAAMDFEAQMGNVATIVDTTKENMDTMGDAVLRMSRRIPKPVADLTESLYQIRSAGVGAADAMHVLEVSSKLSISGLSSATEATKAVTSAMVSFKTQGLSADQIANSFFLTVKEGKTKMEAINESFGSTALIVSNAGVSLQEFNAATAAMTNAGFMASEAQTALRGATIALIKPTGEMVDVLASMGYTGVDAGNQLIKKMGGLVAAMDAIKNASKGTGDNINKAFGRVQGLNALISLTGNQAASFKANLKEQMEAADALSGAYAKQLGTSAAQMQLFQNRVRGLGISIGSLLIPALNKFMGMLSPIIDGIADFAKHHKTLAGIIVKSIGGFALFAGVVGVLGIAIGTVTKAFWLWRSAEIAFNFVNAFTVVSIRMLKTYLLSYPKVAGAAALATDGMTAAMTRLNIASKSTLAIYAAIAAAAVAAMYAAAYVNNKKFTNDAVRTTAEHDAIKAGLPADQRDDFEKKFYGNGEFHLFKDKNLSNQFDSLRNKFASPIQDSINARTGQGDGSPMMDNAQNMMNRADSMQKSVGYVPKGSSDHNITVTIENGSGMAVSASSASGQSANVIPIKIVSTTSRTKSNLS